MERQVCARLEDGAEAFASPTLGGPCLGVNSVTCISECLKIFQFKKLSTIAIPLLHSRHPTAKRILLCRHCQARGKPGEGKTGPGCRGWQGNRMGTGLRK